LPNRLRAAWVASPPGAPARRYSASRIARWKASSSSRSRSRRRRCDSASSRCQRASSCCMNTEPTTQNREPEPRTRTENLNPRTPTEAVRLRRLHHPRHRRGDALPVRRLVLKFPPPERGQPVELGAAVVVGSAPLGLEPAAHFEAMQRRVERALFHPQHLLRGLLDVLDD